VAQGFKKIVIIISILFVLLVVFSVAAIVYTERPKFCISCHIMDPYYASWEKSAHKEVNCLECHYEPTLTAHALGKINGLVQVAQYLTKRYYGRPTAEVSDASCLRGGCHLREEIAGKEILFKDKIRFTHASHLESVKGGIELRCTSCHAQITDDEHIAIDKNACYICHFKNVNAKELKFECLKCHSIKVSSGEHKEYAESPMACSDCHGEIKLGDGNVRGQICLFCHADKEAIENIKDKELMHKAHIKENKVDCISCHDFIEHK